MNVKNKELANMPAQELQAKLADLRMELMKLNTQVATGTVPKSPGQIKNTKKTIARMLQLLGTKHKEAASPNSKKGGTQNQ